MGFRPTFAEGDESKEGEPKKRERLVEVHLLEPPGDDIYGCTVEAEFVKKLRDERPFDSDEALKLQIARDADAARASLSG